MFVIKLPSLWTQGNYVNVIKNKNHRIELLTYLQNFRKTRRKNSWSVANNNTFRENIFSLSTLSAV